MTPRSSTAVAEWAPSTAATPLASWYTESLCDAIGDRLFMFDNSGTPSLELLRFRPEFGGAAGFEDALRERVGVLHAFDHPAFSQVRAVERLDSGDLVLVSTVTTGKRVSEIFRSGPGRPGVHPAFAAWFIRESVSAIAALQRQVDHLAHAALTPDRVILAPNGRLVIVEHVLGGAIDRLGLTVSRLQDLGLVLPGDGNGPARLDQQGDVLQLAWMTLSLLLGRRITPGEYPRRVGTLLDDFADASQGCSPALISAMRRWLERALFSGVGGFSSAIDAQAGLGDLRSHGGRHAIAFAASTTAVEQLAFEVPQQLPPADLMRAELHSVDVALSPAEDVVETTPETLDLPKPVEPAAEVVAAVAPRALPTGGVARWDVRRWSGSWVAASVLAVIATGEGIWLARTGFKRTSAAVVPAPPPAVSVMIDSQQAGDQVIVDGRDVGVTPMTLALKSDMRSIHVRTRPNVDAAVVPPAPKVDRAVDTASAALLNQAAARERRGGLRVSSPIELQVLEGDRVLGSTADGPVVATPGKHELDFVNAELGYQSHHVVEFKAGQIVPMRVSPPDGRVSINAVPWAQVVIDGKPAGETPLGNVALPVGEHQITFRHPQLGERTQKVIVKANAATRVSVVFTR
jgi:hypothetical protein